MTSIPATGAGGGERRARLLRGVRPLGGERVDLLLADGRIADDLPPAEAEAIAERLGRPLVATGGVRC